MKGRDAARQREGEDWGYSSEGSTQTPSTTQSPCPSSPGSPVPTASDGSPLGTQSRATCTQGRRTRTRQGASPDADRALSELAAACGAQIPHETATNGHLQSPSAARHGHSARARPRSCGAPAVHLKPGLLSRFRLSRLFHLPSLHILPGTRTFVPARTLLPAPLPRGVPPCPDPPPPALPVTNHGLGAPRAAPPPPAPPERRQQRPKGAARSRERARAAPARSGCGERPPGAGEAADASVYTSNVNLPLELDTAFLFG